MTNEPIQLNDQTLPDVLAGTKPALILLTTGDGLRGDAKTAFRKAAEDAPDMVVGQINPAKNPEAAERFDVKEKPVLIGWANGDVIVRRVRPWGTDVTLAVDALKEHITLETEVNTVEDAVTEAENTITHTEESNIVLDAPVNVTDETFQTEVIDSEIPVLVDFWAEWCGPCRMVAPTLDKLAKEFAGKVKIAKVNVDENPGLSQAFQIRSIPNMMAVKEKAIVFNQPGALPEPSLRDLVQQLIDLQIPSEAERAAEAEGEAEEAPSPEAGD
jgi:thioredoxin 1